MKKWLFSVFFVIPFLAHSQGSTGINNFNPSPKAALDIKPFGKQGILIPRLAPADTSSINPGLGFNKGLAFYDTANTKFWYWSGFKWLSYGNDTPTISIGKSWLLNGNTLTASDTGATGFVYLGTDNLTPLIFVTNGQQRMKIGRSGNVGIGTTKPTATLHVEGRSSPTLYVNSLSTDTNGIGIYVQSDNSASKSRKGGVFLASNGLNDNHGVSSVATGGARSYGVTGYGASGNKENYGIFGVANGGEYAYGIYAVASGGSVGNFAGYFEGDVYTSGDQQIMGSVGIGIAPTSVKLDIKSLSSPAVRIQDGTQGLNKVLVSDANGNARWDVVKSTIKYTRRSGLSALSISATNTYAKISDYITFTKNFDGTYLEINLNSSFSSGTFAGFASAVQFEVRIDNLPLNLVSAVGVIKTTNTQDFMGLFGAYSGLAGTHTLSVWAKTFPATGTSAGVVIDPIGYEGSISIKETW